MAVAVEASAKNSGLGVTTLSITTLTITAGNLLMVFFGLAKSGFGDDLTALTVNGVSILANVKWNKDDANFTRGYAHYQLSPSAGSPTITATIGGGGADEVSMIAVSFTGVDVAGTPFGTAATANGTTSPSVTVTSASGDMVVAAISTDASTITEGGTIILENENLGGDTSFGAERYAGAASVNATYTISASPNSWAMGGISLKPSAAAGLTPDKWLTGMDRPSVIQRDVITY